MIQNIYQDYIKFIQNIYGIIKNSSAFMTIIRCIYWKHVSGVVYSMRTLIRGEVLQHRDW